MKSLDFNNLADEMLVERECDITKRVYDALEEAKLFG
jgi:hypothetical protein